MGLKGRMCGGRGKYSSMEKERKKITKMGENI